MGEERGCPRLGKPREGEERPLELQQQEGRRLDDQKDKNHKKDNSAITSVSREFG